MSWFTTAQKLREVASSHYRNYIIMQGLYQHPYKKQEQLAPENNQDSVSCSYVIQQYINLGVETPYKEL